MFGRVFPFRIQLTFQYDAVYGNGCDEIGGNYFINGSHDPSSGYITFRKRYNCNPGSASNFWGNLAYRGSSMCGQYTGPSGSMEFGQFDLSLSN